MNMPLRLDPNFALTPSTAHRLAIRIFDRLMRGYENTVALRLWDDRLHVPTGIAPSFTLVVHDPVVLRQLVLDRNPVQLALSYFQDALDFEGDIYDALALKPHLADVRLSWRDKLALLRDATALLNRIDEAVKPTDTLASRIARRFSHRHSKDSDRAAISFHYDVSNAFTNSGWTSSSCTPAPISPASMNRWTRRNATSSNTSAASCACSRASACSTSAAAGARWCAGRLNTTACEPTASH